jgi:hypothetical protein
MQDRERIESLLREVFTELRQDDEPGYTEQKEDFVFHMTDWLEDLNGLMSLYSDSGVGKEAAAKFVVGFLYHVIPHLNAAGRLLLGGIPDPFSVVTRKE